MPHPERILGITVANLREILDVASVPNGYFGSPGIVSPILERAEFRVRDEVEQDVSFKQIIPYVTLAYFTGAGSLLFAYSRGKGGAESRLHAKLSLGLGGHVEESDMGDSLDLFGLTLALQRELDEELVFEKSEYGMPSFHGLINDDSLYDYKPSDPVPVGMVHLGFHFVMPVRLPVAFSGEAHAIQLPGWISGNLLPMVAERFETWSQIVIDSYGKAPNNFLGIGG